MATTKSRTPLALWACVLLVMAVQLVDAEGQCLGGVNGFSCGKESYEILADHLHEATASNEITDNIKAAATLLSDRPDAGEDLRGLIQAFGSLKSDTSDQETLCSEANMANLRRVAETMRDGGNLSPSEITKPIERLNAMIVALIAEARPLCKLGEHRPTSRPSNSGGKRGPAAQVGSLWFRGIPWYVARRAHKDGRHSQ